MFHEYHAASSTQTHKHTQELKNKIDSLGRSLNWIFYGVIANFGVLLHHRLYPLYLLSFAESHVPNVTCYMYVCKTLNINPNSIT